MDGDIDSTIRITIDIAMYRFLTRNIGDIDIDMRDIDIDILCCSALFLAYISLSPAQSMLFHNFRFGIVEM